MGFTDTAHISLEACVSCVTTDHKQRESQKSIAKYHHNRFQEVAVSRSAFVWLLSSLCIVCVCVVKSWESVGC